ncbi:MAG: AAA family ATPase [Proteobacteria bacterium]|nr:AAA family ATPase [Pseudomonadota bacterium]MBU4470272.1 AAA family ATPase [Pseudomonadota bacterium]MCG2752685.1 AAA family ATPase [Desulfobacteraceae bacterium]
MRLKALHIKNFKGIPSFQMNLNGGATSLFGDNGTGKTTIMDSFTWLLFGKDSLNRSDFEIKPIGGNSGLETIVEAVLETPGNLTLSLKKVYQEKWTKKRGSAQSEFTGHSIDHFVEGVPSKKKEFDDAVKAICDEGLFKLLTNPRYFNEVLHWQERRKLLLEVCGDITDADVIASDPTLRSLPEILGKHSLEDYKKIIKARLPEINREIQKIPVRIDEVQSTIPVSPRGIKTVQAVLVTVQATRKLKAQELTQLETGGAIAELTKKLREAEANVISHDNGIASSLAKNKLEHENHIAEASKKVRLIQVEIEALGRQRQQTITQQSTLPPRIEALESENKGLREKWDAENQKAFEWVCGWDKSDKCQTCGQSLPEEKIESSKKNALEIFNAYKAKILGDISASGKKNKERIALIKESEKALDVTISAFDTSNEGLKEDLALAKIDHQVETDKVFIPIEPDAKRLAMVEVINDLEAEIFSVRESGDSTAAIDTLKANIQEIDAKIEALQKEIIAIENGEKSEARIKELKSEERTLAAEYEKLEGHLNLTEAFTRKKVSMLTEKINSKFSMARFKLFEEQINGGLSDCCECTVDGVPYSSLNNAARINAGIDIINTLSEYHGVSIPCFIDNAEAVTRLLESKSQQIKLIVSENDTVLRVESEGK